MKSPRLPVTASLKALCFAAATFSAATAFATDGTWTLLTSGNATGSWQTAANWSGSAIASGTDAVANFNTLNITATSTVSLNGAVHVGALNFSDTTATNDWVIAAGTGGSLVLDSSGAAATINVTNRTLTISANISSNDTEGLNVTGAGTLALSGTNTYSGPTNVSAGGTLSLASFGAINGTINLGSASTAGTLAYTGAAATPASTITLNGNGSINNNGTGLITFSNNIVFGLTSGAQTLTLGGNAVNGGIITGAVYNGTGATTALTVSGSIWTLSGANTYTGITTVTGGVLSFANAGAFYGSTTAAVVSGTAANLVVNSGATAAFNVNQFTSSDIAAILAASNGTVGFKTGSAIGLDTTGSSGAVTQSAAFGGLITNLNSGAIVLGFTKVGAGTLIVNQANTYTGITSVVGGTLQLSDASGIGTSSGLAIGSGATLDANGISFTAGTLNGAGTLALGATTVTATSGTFTGIVSGSGGNITKAGAGTLVLGNIGNTFTGAVSVQAGTLQLGSAISANSTYAFSGNSLSLAANSTLNLSTASGGTIAVTYSFANLTGAIGLAGGNTVSFTQTNNTTQTFGGALSLAGSNTISMSTSAFSGHSVVLNGAISGGGTLTFNTSGAATGAGFTLGSASNNFTGNVVLGTLVTGASAVTSMNLSNSLGAANWTINNAWVVNLSNATHTFTGLNGTAAGAKILGTGASSVLNIGSGNGVDSYAGTLSQSGAGSALAIIKSGTGSLTLSGANGYTGGTTVSGGTLITANTAALGTGSVTISSGATLQLGATGITLSTSGAILAINGTLRVGSAGATAVALTGSGASYAFNGILDLNGLFDSAASGQYTLITTTGVNTDTAVSIAGFSSSTNVASFSNGVLTLTAVPEPSTYGLIGAGALAAVAFVRRRRRVR